MTRCFILFLLVSVFFLSCKDDKKQPAKSAATIEFNIPDTDEEVREKYESGLPKSSVYYSKETKEKVAEVSFHDNGQPYINRKYQGEVLDGESWSYYKNGQPWSLNTFKNGKYHGKYQTWHENGQMNIDGQYVDGKEDGDWFTYYPDGQINTRGLYRNGKKTGTWSSYSPDGKLQKEQFFSEE